jgi:hypothetical protein
MLSGIRLDDRVCQANQRMPHSVFFIGRQTLTLWLVKRIKFGKDIYPFPLPACGAGNTGVQGHCP